MSTFRSFLENKGESYRHPLLTFLAKVPDQRAEIEVARPKDVLGFKAAKIYLHLTIDGKSQPPTEYAWDDDLNAALIAKGIRSISPDNEKARFTLGLRFGFKRAESRFGDGFFNAVLGMVIKENFAEYDEVKDVLKDVHTNSPYMGGNGYTDCHEMIINAISDRARELVENLKYASAEAENILAGAMAYYLDERFTVTDRRRLGWA